MKNFNRTLPDYSARLLEHNRQVELFNKDLGRRARESDPTAGGDFRNGPLEIIYFGDL